jgi:DNA topoisomerase II
MENRDVKNLSQKEQAKLKSVTMYLGSQQIGNYSVYLYDSTTNRFNLEDIEYVPAWYKIVDEIIDNALDHWLHFPKLVNKIEIEFNIKDGSIYVKNGGPSIGIYKTKTHDGKSIWVAQMALSDFNSSSNYDNNKKRYTSGVNGLGSKLTALYSDWFEIDTVDTKKKKRYQQRFENRLDIINEPIITDEKVIKEDYTAIKFMPSYKEFGYSKYNSKYGAVLFKLIEMRAYHAAVYTTANVILNGKHIYVKSFPEYAKMHLQPEMVTIDNIEQENEPALYSTKLLHDEEPNLDICIGLSDGKFQQVSIINGLCISGGNHIRAIQDMIVQELKPNVEKILKATKTKTNFNRNMIINHLFLFVRGKIANLEFDSQTKNNLTNPLENFKKYKFKKSDYKYIWELVKIPIEVMFLGKIKQEENKKVIRGDIHVNKYEGAQYAGGKKSADCTLWITEGDSAATTVKAGILHSCSGLSMRTNGTFTIGGVPMNCRTKYSEKINPKTKEKVIILGEALKNNERLNSLMKVLGLSFGRKYDINTEVGKKEIAELRYGRVIVAVDQDTDGAGIYGLILNFFELFWPNLIKIHYISKFNTPIIRVFSLKNGNIDRQKQILEYYTMGQFKKWLSGEFKGDEAAAQKKYFIKYYKGLGNHEKPDIPYLFTNYKSKLVSAELDKKAREMFSIYYGKDSNVRKEVLKTPAEEAIYETPMPVTKTLSSIVKEFHRARVVRSLPHVCDGLTESRRKVIAGARDYFGNSFTIKDQIKVSALASHVSSFTTYMHGEECLNETITIMAQMFPGGIYLPMLLPRGNFGSRDYGGKDAASPRYINTQLNTPLCQAMFPIKDDYLLDYVFEEGKICEPKYYVPILPLAVMEHSCGNIGVGWSAQFWARDFDSVLKNVRLMVLGKQNKCFPMKTWMRGNKGEIRNINGKEYSVGEYTYNPDQNTIIISELPLNVYPRTYLGLDKDKPKKNDDEKKDRTKLPLWQRPEFASKPLSECTDDNINITLYLKPGEYEKILKKYGDEHFDPIEDYLGLKVPLNSNINCINTDDVVLELNHYEEVVDIWFAERKRLYGIRIRREMILLEIYIKYLENIIRFQDHEGEFGWSTKTDVEKMNADLEKKKFIKIDEELMRSPKFTPIDELEQKILGSEKSTYRYLLSLNNLDKSSKNSEKKKKTLAERKKELNDLIEANKRDAFPGASQWLKEIDELEKIIRTGFETNWGMME